MSNHKFQVPKIEHIGKLWSVMGDASVFYEMFSNTQEIHTEGSFKPKKGDVVLLHGGSDIWPGFYGETPIHECLTKSPTIRDIMERRIIETAIENGIPMIGICRGAQWLCIAAGGSLFQHVTGHQSDHTITTDDKREINTPQAHHQMMRTFNCTHEAIAWCNPPRSTCYMVGKEAPAVEEWEKGWEIEVAYFPTVQGLAIQGHPEWANHKSFRKNTTAFYPYCQELVEKWILGRT